MKKKEWLLTDDPNIMFEGDNEVGRLKKAVWDMSDEELDQVLRCV